MKDIYHPVPPAVQKCALIRVFTVANSGQSAKRNAEVSTFLYTSVPFTLISLTLLADIPNFFVIYCGFEFKQYMNLPSRPLAGLRHLHC